MLRTDERYPQMFHPMNRKNLQPLCHADGSEWCNNWHFRGHCDSECEHKNSHTKQRDQNEKQKGRGYLHAMRKNRQNFVQHHEHAQVPHGQPPAINFEGRGPLFGPEKQNRIPPPPPGQGNHYNQNQNQYKGHNTNRNKNGENKG